MSGPVDFAEKYIEELSKIKKQPILKFPYFVIGLIYSVALWFLMPYMSDYYNNSGYSLGSLIIIIGISFIINYPVIYGISNTIIYFLLKYRDKLREKEKSIEKISELESKFDKSIKIYGLMITFFSFIFSFIYFTIVINFNLSDLLLALSLFIPCLSLTASLGIHKKRKSEIKLRNTFLKLINERIKEIEELVKRATRAVERAEQNPSQNLKDEAQNLVNQLNDEPKKRDLQSRLDKVQDFLHNAAN